MSSRPTRRKNMARRARKRWTPWKHSTLPSKNHTWEYNSVEETWRRGGREGGGGRVSYTIICHSKNHIWEYSTEYNYIIEETWGRGRSVMLEQYHSWQSIYAHVHIYNWSIQQYCLYCTDCHAIARAKVLSRSRIKLLYWCNKSHCTNSHGRCSFFAQQITQCNCREGQPSKGRTQLSELISKGAIMVQWCGCLGHHRGCHMVVISSVSLWSPLHLSQR